MWEVDPETKSKLLALQKRPGNDRCCDCPAASPQWASPKFGTFICLECAGRHRGLGVHISFVRSITMDAFKGGEMARMDLGGNNAWRAFWEEKQGGRAKPKWEDISLEERYSGEVGEEWKERLACRVEGREFTGVPQPPKRAQATSKTSPARTASPGVGAGVDVASKRKEQNEAFFARMGNENANRSAALPPSQGGKYGGFGSEPAPSGMGRGESAGEGGVLPGVDDFQKDPVAALTKGLGWFTTTVGRGAKTVNDGWIQPTAQKIAQSDLQTQARLTAASLAQNIQTGTKGAAEQFNKFIEGGNDPSSSSATAATSKAGIGGRRPGNAAVDPDRRDFWDSFGENKNDGLLGSGGGKGGGGGGGGGLMASKAGRGSNAIGTAAMKKGSSTSSSSAAGGAKEDNWEEW